MAHVGLGAAAGVVLWRRPGNRAAGPLLAAALVAGMFVGVLLAMPMLWRRLEGGGAPGRGDLIPVGIWLIVFLAESEILRSSWVKERFTRHPDDERKDRAGV